MCSGSRPAKQTVPPLVGAARESVRRITDELRYNPYATQGAQNFSTVLGGWPPPTTLVEQEPAPQEPWTGERKLDLPEE